MAGNGRSSMRQSKLGSRRLAGLAPHLLVALAAVSSLSSATPLLAQSESVAVGDLSVPLSRQRQHEGLLMVDYQQINVPGIEDIDLLGTHAMLRVNDWAYLGLGGYFPLAQGEYGGFMALGGIVHAQTNITDRIFVNAGLSFGGGGGGLSIAQSRQLSGTGGYLRTYAGLGYQFDGYALGLTYSSMEFKDSLIDDDQLSIFFQKDFGYRTGSYDKQNTGLSFLPASELQGHGAMLSFGLDNYHQINPQGSYKGDIHAADLQYSNFGPRGGYWYVAAAAGYEGLPLYNQFIAGAGKRFALSERVNLYAQVGAGSGGYAPSLIETGSGLLVYPKVSAEYRLNNTTGVALTAGYLMSVDGSSRNATVGIALNRHFGNPAAENRRGNIISGRFKGYRFSVANETVTDVSYLDVKRDDFNMMTLQLDKSLGDHFYMPGRIAIAYEDYRSYPGNGEISLGLGVQSRYLSGDRMQFFGEVQLGANVEGPIVRPAVGVELAVNENVALRASVAQAYGRDYEASSISLGLTSRFSLLEF